MRAIHARYLAHVVLASSIALAGCAGVSIHSDTREAQGKALADAWKAVDLKTRFETNRANYAAILDKEIAAAERVTRLSAQTALRAGVLDGTVDDKFVSRIQARVNALAGSSKGAAEWIDARKSEAFVRAGLARAQEQLSFWGFELPTCEEMTSSSSAETLAPLQRTAQTNTVKGGVIKAALEEAVRLCTDPRLKAADQLAIGGEIRKAKDDRVAMAAEIEKDIAAGRALRNEYTSAVQAHSDALAKLKEGGGNRDDVRDAAKRLQEVIPKLEKAQDVFSKQFVSRQKIESINAFTAALSDPTKDKEALTGDSKAAAALVFFSTWADETSNSLANAQEATLAPLLLERDLLKARLAGLTREADNAKARLANRERKIQVLTDETEALQRSLTDSAKAPKLLKLTLLQALPSKEEDDRKATPPTREELDQRNMLLRGLGRYVHAEGRIQAESRKLDIQLNALMHERLLALSEANVGQWDALIAGGVSQIVDYSGTGIRAEQLSAFINSLSLLWIGSGVNK